MRTVFPVIRRETEEPSPVSFAEGGCARVCTGENDVCPGTAVRGCYNFYVDEPGEGFRDSFKAYADACHRHGALAFTSFNHTGAYMRVMPKGAMPPMPAGPADAAGDGPDAAAVKAAVTL